MHHELESTIIPPPGGNWADPVVPVGGIGGGRDGVLDVKKLQLDVEMKLFLSGRVRFWCSEKISDSSVFPPLLSGVDPAPTDVSEPGFTRALHSVDGDVALLVRNKVVVRWRRGWRILLLSEESLLSRLLPTGLIEAEPDRVRVKVFETADRWCLWWGIWSVRLLVEFVKQVVSSLGRGVQFSQCSEGVEIWGSGRCLEISVKSVGLTSDVLEMVELRVGHFIGTDNELEIFTWFGRDRCRLLKPRRSWIVNKSCRSLSSLLNVISKYFKIK